MRYMDRKYGLGKTKNMDKKAENVVKEKQEK